MKVRVTIGPNGEIEVITQEGTFTEGAEKLSSLLAHLDAAGVELADISPPEQHRHDDPVHVHGHQLAGHTHG